MKMKLERTSRDVGAACRSGALHLLTGLCLWFLSLGACAQPWGLQWRDAPDGQAAEVVSVAAGSPAAAAGMRPGDRVLQAQQFLVRNATDFMNIIRLSEGRDTLLLRVSRDGWEKELRLAAAAVAPPPPLPPPPSPPRAWLGLQLTDLASDASGRSPPGASVTGTATGGPAAQAGLRPGDVLTRLDGRPIANAAELAAVLADWPSGRALRLSVMREGWMRDVTIVPGAMPTQGAADPPRTMPPVAPTTALPPAATPPASPTPPVSPTPRFVPEVRAPSDLTAAGRDPGDAASPPGQKALVSVGDFQVKAATASQAVGDGLREMLVTALHNSGAYAVVERMDLQALAAEQALSRSRMARPGSAVPEQRMEVADIMVYGALTEFEGEARGSAAQVGVPNLPLTFGRSATTAHMAIDVRIVDVASGRILGAQRIAGDARSSQSRVGAEPTLRGVGIPVGLGMFQNTPMEAAIRSCVERAVAYVSATVPSAYFRHR